MSARRPWLWLVLIGLVCALLGLLVWLANRYEASQWQQRLEHDAADALADLRAGLTRNVQSLQALEQELPSVGAWRIDAAELLRQHREILQLEWRNSALAVQAQVDSPFYPPHTARRTQQTALADVAQACRSARRFSGAAYSPSYFLPLTGGLGLEVMEMCLPLGGAAQPTGYLVVTYGLQALLTEWISAALSRSHSLTFTEPDGTRLATHGARLPGLARRSTQQLLDLPGYTLVLRVQSERAAPTLFPNVLTALVTALALALVIVLMLLSRDMLRRQRAERRLAEALAFRKAMEDSLMTGLRARDLHGRISYVNPAFCQMVGFEAGELLGTGVPAPYWPTERADEYRNRQALRLAGSHWPREGFESLFMRKDGTRFPVLIIEAPLIDSKGQQTGWMSACVDLSEQRRVEELSRASLERLQASARLATVGEMASLLSHELNQPLAAISSFAVGSLNMLALSPGEPPGPDLVQALRRIAEQAERAGKVIHSVHGFVRRRDQARQMTQAQELFDAVMPLVVLQAGKLGVQLQVDHLPALPALWCDRTLLEQVLLNLARNAMQAASQSPCAPEPPWVGLSVCRYTDDTGRTGLVFSVADNGAGIPPEIAQKMFTPFFTTKAEGMGLGLSLCRTVVEQHGGALAFEPRRPRGSVFSFTLPSAVPQPDHAPAG